MKKSLVSLSIAAMVLAGSAYADNHTKGTHKGHVHKSVGESCSDKCDDLRRQIEDLNASYQERLQALETSVEELEEVAHEHETLLLDPAEDSWTLGFDVWWTDFSGGEQTLGALTGFSPAAVPTVLSPLISRQDDDTAWTASIAFQDDVDSSWNFRYTNADTSTNYAVTSPGVAGGPAGGLLFASAPFAAFGGLATIAAAHSDMVATRATDVDDFEVGKENRVWANEKFAVNWNWGIRHAEVDDALSATYTNIAVDGQPTATLASSSNFDGWGPSAGLRARYYLSDDFEVQGNLGMAALVGESTNTVVVTEDTTIFDGGPAATTVNAAQRINNVNPVLDLGSRFVWHAGDDLDVHIGYSTTRYFDAISQQTGITTVEQDLNLEGIRAGIQWNFD